MENRITKVEAEPMLEVYETYLQESLGDLYEPSNPDSDLVEKLEFQRPLENDDPKTQEGFDNRVKYLNEVFEDYQNFRNILLNYGESPFVYRDKATELLSRN
ncbi:hypothetical protein HOD29_05185 [archaeon]|jgi:hypothetical protein|nr:hypothetical protein [archaeon]